MASSTTQSSSLSPLESSGDGYHDCVMVTGVKRVTTTETTTSTITTTKARATAPSLPRPTPPTPPARPARESAGSPQKSLADDPEAAAAFNSLFKQPGSELLRAKSKRQRELAGARAAEKRTRQVEKTAANPVAPEREPSLHKARAVVSHKSLREQAGTEERAHPGSEHEAASQESQVRRRGAYSGRSSKMVTVGSQDRVRAFPGESLVSEKGNLKCKACATTLGCKSYPLFMCLAPYTQGATEDLLRTRMQDSVHDVRAYANERIGFLPTCSEAHNIELFKAAKLVNFTYMKQHFYTDAEIRTLMVFPFVTNHVINALVREKDEYRLAAGDADAECDLLAFWRDSRSRLPAWHMVAMDLALIQPSSCFIERVFSILGAVMDSRQEQALSDRITAAVLLKYNRTAEGTRRG